MRLGLYGCYDADAPRLANMLEGFGLTAVHEPLWPAGAERQAVARAPWTMGAAWLSARRRLWLRRAELRGVEALLVPYPGHLVMGAARRVADGLGVPLLFDPFLSLSDTLAGDRGVIRPGGLQDRLWLALDRRALRLADVVLADTPAMAGFYAELGARKLAVVPVGADERVFVPTPEPDTAAVEVLFVGSMLPLHGLPVIVEAARLLAEHPRLRFTLVGQGPVDVAGLVRTAGLDGKVRLLESVPRAALPELLAGAHVCLGLFGASAKAGRVVPHKVYEAAAAGRVVVARRSAALAEAFEDTLVPADTPTELAEALAALADDPAGRRARAAAARELFMSRYQRRHIAAKLRSAVEAAR